MKDRERIGEARRPRRVDHRRRLGQ